MFFLIAYFNMMCHTSFPNTCLGFCVFKHLIFQLDYFLIMTRTRERKYKRVLPNSMASWLFWRSYTCTCTQMTIWQEPTGRQQLREAMANYSGLDHSGGHLRERRELVSWTDPGRKNKSFCEIKFPEALSPDTSLGLNEKYHSRVGHFWLWRYL